MGELILPFAVYVRPVYLKGASWTCPCITLPLLYVTYNTPIQPQALHGYLLEIMQTQKK